MNIFDYFHLDHANIELKLHEFTENYNNLSAQEVFDRSVAIFDSIRIHFEKQDDLIFKNIQHIEALQSAKANAKTDKQAILDKIDDVINIHIDEPAFNESMLSVLKLIENHIRLTDKQLYADMQKYVSPEILAKIDHDINIEILS